MARLDRLLFNHRNALQTCESLLDGPLHTTERAQVLHELGVIFYDLRDFDSALDRILQALALTPLEASLLVDLAHTLIRLGRTEEAINSARMAVRLAPLHQAAHYLLGNGYTQMNYRQLESAYPAAFAHGTARSALEQSEALLTTGQTSAARETLLRLARKEGTLADVRVHLGALAFSCRRHRAARLLFRAALKRCPHYGRAHHGLAKTLEAELLAIQAHRTADETRFAAAPPPTLPEFNRFVLNAPTLSPRHAKRVALSIAPWRRFLPVLVDSGATYYIKPLHQLLSETPEQEVLRNRRISYDSRLWDDVRGCGGYHTVTGIEDVERSIVGGYDTVLHELTHQVHALLPRVRQRQIEALYRRTLARQATGEEAFISRYAGTNAQEYLAEAAHALARPRRDRFDRREIVAERLLERDPELVALVQELQAGGDVDSAWAVGQVNRGSAHLRRGRTEEALAAYRRAVERSPSEESTRGALLSALLKSGDTERALAEARRVAQKTPQSATYSLLLAEALWLAGEGLPKAIAHLEASRSTVRCDERHRLDQKLSALYWVAGDATGAQTAAERVLAAHADAPSGLWALAQAQALRGAWAAAWAAYEAAVLQRTGIAELRCDYARDLLRAGEVERATEQVEAARLLEPEEPQVLACLAWLQQTKGQPEDARRSAKKALAVAPWCDLARLRLVLAEQHLGSLKAAAVALEPWRHRLETGQPPEYIFRADLGRYELIYTQPAVERALLDPITTAAWPASPSAQRSPLPTPSSQ
jgi:tetratricopeptide (TPR) repeat protein